MTPVGFHLATTPSILPAAVIARGSSSYLNFWGQYSGEGQGGTCAVQDLQDGAEPKLPVERMRNPMTVTPEARPKCLQPTGCAAPYY